MDLGYFNHGEHKHFTGQNIGSNSIDEMINNITAQQNFEDNTASPLLDLINQSDIECSTFMPQSFCVKSEEQNQTNPTEPAQYSRLLTFIKSVTDPTCKAELSTLLYPVFIHSYLELLQKGCMEDAYSFLNEYKSLFSKNAKYLPVIEELTKVKYHRDIDSYQRIRYFRENKYSLKISEDTFSVLESFFIQDVNFPLLELIQSKLDLTISYSHELDTDPETEHDEDSNPRPPPQEDTEFKVDYSKIPEYRRYLEAKRRLENVPPHPQPLMRWAIHNLEEASCAEINPDASLMLSASLNGKILVTRLVSPMINDVMYVPVNSVPLAVTTPDAIPLRLIKRMDWTYMNVYGNKGAVHDVSFVPDSKLFLSVSSDNYLRAYSLDTYNCVMKYSGHDMTVWSVEACNKGLALTSSRDTTARLWSLDQLYPVRIFVGHRQDVTCARFHPKATYIGTGSYDKAVRLWSITDGSTARVFANHDSAVLSIAFSPCGKYLASGGEDGLVLIHELTSGKVVSSFHLTGFEPVTSLAWSMTGETVVASSVTGTVQMTAWPSVAKIGAVDMSTIVTYHNVLDRVLNVQYKTSTPSSPICLGLAKDTDKDTVVIKEQTTAPT